MALIVHFSTRLSDACRHLTSTVTAKEHKSETREDTVDSFHNPDMNGIPSVLVGSVLLPLIQGLR
jgi:hypothetical protein